MTLYLVRHGKAGTRDNSDPLDTQRHLDRKGLRQAVWMADQLGGRPIGALWSSPLPRCLETVEPIAARLGLDVEPTEALTEGTELEITWRVVEQALLRGTDTVLCSHGDLIPALIHRAECRGMTVEGPAGFVKGSIWILTVDGDRISGGTYVAPPATSELPNS